MKGVKVTMPSFPIKKPTKIKRLPKKSRLTDKKINALLKEALPGARELNEKLQRAFELLESNASFRLK